MLQSPHIVLELAVGNGLERFCCTGTFLFKPSIIPDDKCTLSQYFNQVSTDSLSPNIPEQTSFSALESPTSTGFTTCPVDLVLTCSRNIQNHPIGNWNPQKGSLSTTIPTLEREAVYEEET
jgi:hypothetical protein